MSIVRFSLVVLCEINCDGVDRPVMLFKGGGGGEGEGEGLLWWRGQKKQDG